MSNSRNFSQSGSGCNSSWSTTKVDENIQRQNDQRNRFQRARAGQYRRYDGRNRLESWPVCSNASVRDQRSEYRGRARRRGNWTDNSRRGGNRGISSTDRSHSSTRAGTTSGRSDASASASASASDQSQTAGNRMNIPGFYFDIKRNRYFRILPEHAAAGDPGFVTTQSLQRQERERQRMNLLHHPFGAMHLEQLQSAEENEDDDDAGPMESVIRKHASEAKTRPKKLDSAVHLAMRRELGGLSSTAHRRLMSENRTRISGDDGGKASTICKILEDAPGETLQRCQFVEPTPDGRALFGTWSMRDKGWSRIMCAKVATDYRRCDKDRYGLELHSTDNYIYVMEKNVVDLCRAQIDVSVTGVLYITVPPSNPGSRIFLQPVPELSQISDPEHLMSPVYNFHWGLDEGAWSCAWDAIGQRMSVGLERYGMIYDVLYDKNFKLFSHHKSVLTQKFSKDGRLLFMGLRGADVLCCDLRRQYHHAVYSLHQPSTCSLRLMSDTNYLVAADFTGGIKLWDLRKQRVLRSFNMNNNTHTKLPVVVDEQDSLVLAVGEDGTTTAWSLQTGEVLRRIACPYPVNDISELPRVCYSSSWGGVPGNSAIVLGVGDEAHFYEFKS